MLENKIKKNLEWIPCPNFNELSLRRLFEHFDKQTTFPPLYCDPICKYLAISESLPIAKFKQIKSDLLVAGKVYLSTEQKYKLEKLQAASQCKCSINFYFRIPGQIYQARGITTVNRILNTTLEHMKRLLSMSYWLSTSWKCTEYVV